MYPGNIPHALVGTVFAHGMNTACDWRRIKVVFQCSVVGQGQSAAAPLFSP